MKLAKSKIVMAGVLASVILLIQAGVALSDTLVSENLGTSHYTASTVQAPVATYEPWKAFDGLESTRWQANQSVLPTNPASFGWIEVDLGHEYLLSDLHLHVYTLAAPGATATFNAYASQNPMQGNLTGATLLHVFSPGPFSTGEELEYDIPDGTVLARYVQIQTTMDVKYNTTNGYLRPAWREIEVYADVVPEPSTFILVGAGLGGLALLRRRRG
jgi:hypothetical protein